MTERELHRFEPDWCIAPADILQEWMDDHDVTILELAPGAREMIRDLLNRGPLTELHAEVLEKATQISARMWLALEHNYRAGLAAGLIDATDTPVSEGN